MELLVNTEVQCESENLLTKAVQSVIDKMNYGDTLVFPKGNYVLSTIYLKSGITLRFEIGCKILGSENFNDYDRDEKVDYPLYQDASHSFFHCSLFVGENAENITIEGAGEIDMRSVWDEQNVRNMAHRGAKCIALKNCKNVKLKDFTVKNCTDLAVYFAGCENVEIIGLNVKTYIDGISPDNCKNVVIENCSVESGDDGKYYAKLPSRTIEMKDDEKYLEYFANGGCVIEFMQDETVWGEDLTKYEGFPVYENPSPGNKKGGITTLEEKSLGCVEKAGSTKIVDVLFYGEQVKKQGVSTLNAPGNDLIAATALAASGCQIVLFTTGRGTPFSTFVPTFKIASNDFLAEKKSGWIDFNAYGMDEKALYKSIIVVINGEMKCKSEDIREIAFYKKGVTL